MQLRGCLRAGRADYSQKSLLEQGEGIHSCRNRHGSVVSCGVGAQESPREASPLISAGPWCLSLPPLAALFPQQLPRASGSPCSQLLAQQLRGGCAARAGDTPLIQIAAHKGCVPGTRAAPWGTETTRAANATKYATTTSHDKAIGCFRINGHFTSLSKAWRARERSRN